MEYGEETVAYIEQNFVRLLDIQSEVERLSQISEGRSVVALTHRAGLLDPDAQITEGELTTEQVFEVYQRHGSNNLVAAADMARRHNESTRYAARVEANGIIRIALGDIIKQDAANHGEENLPPVEAYVAACSFTEGSVVSNSFETDAEIVDFTSLKLTGIPRIGSVESLRITRTDGYLIRGVAFVLIDGKFSRVHKRVEPVRDELLHTLDELDPGLVTYLTPLLVGDYVDDQSAEQFLEDIARVCSGTPLYEEFRKVMPAVLERARAAKSSAALSVQTGTRLPASEELAELQAILSTI